MALFKDVRQIFSIILPIFLFGAMFFMPIGEQSVVYAKDIPGHDLAQEVATNVAKEALAETFNGLCGGNSGMDCVVYNFVRVGVWSMQFSLFILGIVGVLLDVVLLLTFNMGAILAPGTSAGDAVAAGWTIFRDLANLLFIAGFVWVAVAMILQINVPGGSVGKFIANIIIAALLVNFSYFFTGAIIDLSNNTSRLIYEQGVLNGDQSLTIGTASGNRIRSLTETIGLVTKDDQGVSVGTEEDTEKTGISAYTSFIAGQFLNQTKLVSILNPQEIAAEANKDPTYTLSFFTIIATIFIIMTIELFAGLLFVILARFVILILLLILSPLIVFRIMGIPPFSEWGNQWWKSLVSQVIFLPVFVFLVAVSFRTIAGFADAFGGDSGITLGALLRDPSGDQFNGALGLIILFGIAFAMLKYSKTIAQNMAQGKTLPLPSVEGIQGAASKAGDVFGSRAGVFGRLPGALMYRLFGGGLSSLARSVGDQEGVRRSVEALQSAYSRIPLVGDPLKDERRRRARESGKERIENANAEIAKWEDRKKIAEENNDIQGIAAADAQIRAHKDSRKSAYSDMYDTMGPAKLAQYLRQNPEQIHDALDALGGEKADDIAERLKGVNIPKKKEAGEGSDDKKSNDGAGKGADTEAAKRFAEQSAALYAEAGGKNPKADDRQHRVDLRRSLQNEENTKAFTAAVRDLGMKLSQLPTDILVEKHVAAELQVNDLDALRTAAYVDESIPHEDYERVRKAAPKDVRQEHDRGPGKYGN